LRRVADAEKWAWHGRKACGMDRAVGLEAGYKRLSKLAATDLTMAARRWDPANGPNGVLERADNRMSVARATGHGRPENDIRAKAFVTRRGNCHQAR